MPFKSKAQQRFMFATNPTMAREFAEHTNFKKLPEKVKKKKLEKAAELVELLKVAGLPPVVIDRPKGFKKTFHTQKGPMEMEYPLDYGYFDGVINPQDGEGADVFMGSGGETGLHGKFMKGKDLTGVWEPDEHKWYSGLTAPEHSNLMAWWASQNPTLVRDDQRFDTHESLAQDLAALSAQSSPTEKRAMNDFYANGDHDYYCSDCQKSFDKQGGTCPKCKKDVRYSNRHLHPEITRARNEKRASDPFEAGSAKAAVPDRWGLMSFGDYQATVPGSSLAGVEGVTIGARKPLLHARESVREMSEPKPLPAAGVVPSEVKTDGVPPVPAPVVPRPKSTQISISDDSDRIRNALVLAGALGIGAGGYGLYRMLRPKRVKQAAMISWEEVREAGRGIPVGGTVAYDYHCKPCDHSFDGNSGKCPICEKDRSSTNTSRTKKANAPQVQAPVLPSVTNFLPGRTPMQAQPQVQKPTVQKPAQPTQAPQQEMKGEGSEDIKRQWMGGVMARGIGLGKASSEWAGGRQANGEGAEMTERGMEGVLDAVLGVKGVERVKEGEWGKVGSGETTKDLVTPSIHLKAAGSSLPADVLQLAAPFALAFLRGCEDQGLSPDQAVERVKQAAAMDPLVAEEFEDLARLLKMGSGGAIVRIGGRILDKADDAARAAPSVAPGAARVGKLVPTAPLKLTPTPVPKPPLPPQPNAAPIMAKPPAPAPAAPVAAPAKPVASINKPAPAAMGTADDASRSINITPDSIGAQAASAPIKVAPSVAAPPRTPVSATPAVPSKPIAPATPASPAKPAVPSTPAKPAAPMAPTAPPPVTAGPHPAGAFPKAVEPLSLGGGVPAVAPAATASATAASTAAAVAREKTMLGRVAGAAGRGVEKVNLRNAGEAVFGDTRLGRTLAPLTDNRAGRFAGQLGRTAAVPLDAALNVVTGKGALQNMLQGNLAPTLGYGAAGLTLPYGGALVRGEKMPETNLNQTAMSAFGLRPFIAGANGLGAGLGGGERLSSLPAFVGGNAKDLQDVTQTTLGAATSPTRALQLNQARTTGALLLRNSVPELPNAMFGLDSPNSKTREMEAELKTLQGKQDPESVARAQVLAGAISENKENQLGPLADWSYEKRDQVMRDLKPLLSDPNLDPAERARIEKEVSKYEMPNTGAAVGVGAAGGMPPTQETLPPFPEETLPDLPPDVTQKITREQTETRLADLNQKARQGALTPEEQAEGVKLFKEQTTQAMDTAFSLVQKQTGMSPEQFQAGLQSKDPANPVNQKGMGITAAEIEKQTGEPAGLSQVHEFWNGLEGWQKGMMIAGMGLGLISMMSMLMGGEDGGGIMGTLAGGAGLAALGYGVSGGHPGELLRGDFWKGLMAGKQPGSDMPMPASSAASLGVGAAGGNPAFDPKGPPPVKPQAGGPLPQRQQPAAKPTTPGGPSTPSGPSVGAAQATIPAPASTGPVPTVKMPVGSSFAGFANFSRETAKPQVARALAPFLKPGGEFDKDKLMKATPEELVPVMKVLSENAQRELWNEAKKNPGTKATFEAVQRLR